jgi:hypothetical protein
MGKAAAYSQCSSFQSLLSWAWTCFLDLLPKLHQLLVQLLYLLVNPCTPGI